MRFGRRSTPPAATYAALVAGRHLWLVLDAPGEVSLAGQEVAAHPEPQGPLHGVRLDVRGVPAGSHPLLIDGRPLLGPPLPAPTPATRTRLERRDDGALVLVREQTRTGASVRGLRLVGDSVEVDLDLPPGTTNARLVRDLRLDGSTITVGPADLAGALPGDVPVLVGGGPVHRRANRLADPGAGALLPAVHPVGAEQPLGRLRWSTEATLVVRVHGGQGEQVGSR